MLRWLVGGTGAATTLAVAGLYRERSLLISETVTEAETQRAESASKCFALEGEIADLKKKEKSQQLALEDKMSTVDALWGERRNRLASETERAADSIFCLPESFSILNGIQAHCNDNARKFPLFYEEFDLNASKLHTVNMLLDFVLGGRRSGGDSSSTAQETATACPRSLQAIAPAMGMFRSDPILSGINLLLHAENKLKSVRPDDVLPSSPAELSRTFVPLMQNFHDACQEAAKQAPPPAQQQQQKGSSELSRAHPSSGDDLLAHDDGEGPDAPPPLGFFVDRVVPKLVDATHMTTSFEADARLQRQLKEREHRRNVIASWNLYNNEDVFAAIDYVTSTHKEVIEAATKGQAWPLHPAVAPAMKNLCVWSLAAEQYLSEAQTAQVLANVTRCTSHSFVQVNEQHHSQTATSQ